MSLQPKDKIIFSYEDFAAIRLWLPKYVTPRLNTKLGRNHWILTKMKKEICFFRQNRPQARVKVTITLHGSKLRDIDNGALRYEKCVVNDDPGTIDFIFRQVKTTKDKRGTEILIETADRLPIRPRPIPPRPAPPRPAEGHDLSSDRGSTSNLNRLGL